VFENRVSLVRGIEAFSELEAGGITTEEVVEPVAGPGASKASGAFGRIHAQAGRIKGAGRRIARRVQAFLVGDQRPRSGEEDGGIRPENIVWIFGASRTGSSWLSGMMSELPRHTVWNEPLVGALFGDLYYSRAKHLIGKPGKHYILGEDYRKSWLGSICAFVLSEASARFPEAEGPDNYLVVKEPNGSLGAPLLMEALPESGMILLIRDPRDVVASSMDARREGGWQYERRKRREWRPESRVDKDPDAFVRNRAKAYLERIEATKRAYEAHRGRKVLVKYEELRADTLGTMKRIYSVLEIPVEEGRLAKAVEKHSWEKVPDEQKGEGKFYRKATPGGWREDLTPKQIKTVEKITAPLLDELYPET
jgi:sulfotransferase family protein